MADVVLHFWGSQTVAEKNRLSNQAYMVCLTLTYMSCHGNVQLTLAVTYQSSYPGYQLDLLMTCCMSIKILQSTPGQSSQRLRSEGSQVKLALE